MCINGRQGVRHSVKDLSSKRKSTWVKSGFPPIQAISVEQASESNRFSQIGLLG